MVFMISAFFVIFELPSAVLYTWETLAFLVFRQPRPTWFPLAAFFSNQLVSINKAVNFIVYCGAGQHFRHKFIKLICQRYYYGSRQSSRYYFSPSSRTLNENFNSGIYDASSGRPSPLRRHAPSRRTTSCSSHIYGMTSKNREYSGIIKNDRAIDL